MPGSEEELLQNIYQRSRQIRRRRRGARIGLGAALSVALVVTFLPRGAVHPDHVAEAPTTSPSASTSGPSASPSPSPSDSACACLFTPKPGGGPGPGGGGPAPPPPAGMVLALSGERDGNWDIYTMNADGTGVTRLTSDPRPERDPDWSPDGKRIVFTRFNDIDDQFGDLYVMNADGTGIRFLATGAAADWSPDGRRLLYYDRPAPPTEGAATVASIYLINADGSGGRLVMPNAADPAWFPDGVHFSFGGLSTEPNTSEKKEPTQVFRARIDSTEKEKLTTNTTYACYPDVSPDGRKIAYLSFEASYRDAEGRMHETGELQVHVMNIDGSGQTRLTFNQGRERVVSWSPDGRWIAVGRDPDGDPRWTIVAISEEQAGPTPSAIWLIRSDGSGEVMIPQGELENYSDPSFRPSG